MYFRYFTDKLGILKFRKRVGKGETILYSGINNVIRLVSCVEDAQNVLTTEQVESVFKTFKANTQAPKYKPILSRLMSRAGKMFRNACSDETTKITLVRGNVQLIKTIKLKTNAHKLVSA